MIEFLKEMTKIKRELIEEKKRRLPFFRLLRMAEKTTSHPLSLSEAIRSGGGIIAEIKRASPSKGVLFEGEVKELGEVYQANGASAISVVTEERYFRGQLKDIQDLKGFIKVPILRKDFIIDEYQIVETKLAGADALLLITALLSRKRLEDLLNLTRELGMEALVEVHTKEELLKALDASAEVVGINNRDLNTFEVDLNVSRRLLPLISSSKVKIVESGIRKEKDLVFYRGLGADGFLIGEALVKAADPGKKLRSFCSALRGKG